MHIERLIHTSTRFTNQTNPLLSATGSTCLTLSYFTCLRWWYSASSSHDVKMQPGTQGIRELLLLHLLTARLFSSLQVPPTGSVSFCFTGSSMTVAGCCSPKTLITASDKCSKAFPSSVFPLCRFSSSHLPSGFSDFRTFNNSDSSNCEHKKDGVKFKQAPVSGQLVSLRELRGVSLRSYLHTLSRGRHTIPLSSICANVHIYTSNLFRWNVFSSVRLRCEDVHHVYVPLFIFPGGSTHKPQQSKRLLLRNTWLT